MTGIRESELPALRKLADELAKGRGERATTGHLLAAIASGEGHAPALLRERRLSAEVLLKAARVLVDDHNDAIARALQRARELAARSPVREAGALHLLFALCHERETAAYRAVAQCGSDVAKLRTAAMQIAMGIAAPRRIPASAQLPLTAAPLAPAQKAPATSPASGLGTAAQRPARSLSSPAPSPSLSPPPSGTPTPLPSPNPSPMPSSNAARPRRGLKAVPAGGAASFVRFELDAKRAPTLAAVGRNLTLAAARGELDPVLGRDIEIDRALDVLAKRKANCPCLVGPAGVGKTSVVHGLAHRMASGSAPGEDRIVVEIDTASLVAGTGVRGALGERMAQMKAEAQRTDGRVILFFDEMHALLASDDEAAAELRVALARGEIACIGAMTPEDYKRASAADPGIARRMTVIEVAELSPDEAVLALEHVAPALERHHRVRFSQEAIAAAVAWSARYLPERALPDKAVSLLDLAGARAKRRGEPEVGRDQVAGVVSETTGVPTSRLLETDGERMLHLEEALAERIVGHRDALARVARVLRRNASGFRSRRPIGSFLLLGPTGVGKTETAKAIAECLFHSPHAMTRLDLSEYAEAHAIARLVGAPPGYVGHEAGGQLTESVRKRPYQVLLLDEIEKCDRDVLEAFLQVFDEGRMTDGRGRVVDFTNVVIVMTSNLGAGVAKPARERARIGFGAGDAAERNTTAYEDAVCAAARAALPPELYNRIDEVIAFAPLGKSDVAEVAHRMLRALGKELEAARGVRLEVTDAAVSALLEQGGFDAELGARPMRRAIGRFVEAPIAEMLLRGDLTKGDVARVVGDRDGRVQIERARPARRERIGDRASVH
jgi:ATP-dependent Clp protease ATP-binding subunit ClpC